MFGITRNDLHNAGRKLKPIEMLLFHYPLANQQIVVTWSYTEALQG